MNRRVVRAATIASTAFVAAFAGGGVASADAGTVQSDLADVSAVNLGEVRAAENSVLANSIARAIAETGTSEDKFAKFSNAPPR
ncbi:hypothetical protein GCM10022225_42320 [Plantactinospora mayteni]|uniref:Secreted protein n=1 Tax=Plantactinospora mayteni TaxID=566021 RepID=A0ABQ4EUC4_9ACTN|nr:hypothetical protein [Plantactinospora mayteni]GIG98256.1 hypothetical protein Pma05_48290 [Plantactinospora mayteni]